MILTPPLLEASSITKTFGGVTALSEVSFAIEPGEIVAIIGENGAGKSTLAKVMSGVLSPDAGIVAVDGLKREFYSSGEAAEYGISRIPQELELCDSMTVAENLLLGREPSKSMGRLDFSECQKMTQSALEMVDLKIDSHQLVGDLGHGHRQMIAIARALHTSARLLILDEPTATLSPLETKVLLHRLIEMKKSGSAIIMITHRLAEVEEIADRVIILRDGAKVGSLAGKEIQRDSMIRCMVGRDLSPIESEVSNHGDPRLVVNELVTQDHPDAVSLQVRSGERVALAGLVGSGRSELLEAIFGLRPRSGHVSVDQCDLSRGGVKESVRAGLALIPEERSSQGLALQQSVSENASLPGLYREAGKFGMLARHAGVAVAHKIVKDLDVRPPRTDIPASDLSGGNQQKIVIGKWLDLDPAVVLLDEPTRGVDVGAREEIHRRIRDLSLAGKSVLFASSEMEEVLALSHRIIVLSEGKIMGTLVSSETTEEEIMALATGGEIHE